MSDSLCFAGITELSRLIRKKDISCQELTEVFLNRISLAQPKLNCFISIIEQQAKAEAQSIDNEIHKGKIGALAGIPIAHKDLFCTQGVLTSCASKMLADFIPPYDATIVSRLKSEGSICLGKTNMDEFAMGSSNENSFFGRVLNPWSHARVSGGSSGGSAAAVAAGLVTAATGSDTGGSIRQPAAFCGVTGVKPTYGKLSRFGMVGFAPSLDQAGILARKAEDCALLLDTMAGYDPMDPTSKDSDGSCCALLHSPLKETILGIPKQFLPDNLDSQVRDNVEQGIKVLEQMGCRVKIIDIPSIEYSIPAYFTIAPAECSSNLAKYDGIRFGHKSIAANDNYTDSVVKTRSEGFGFEVKRRILIGTHVLSKGYEKYYLQAKKIRQLIRDEFKKAFVEVDIIIGPTTTTPAFKSGEKLSDPVKMYLNDLYTSCANLAGLPALSMPSGFIDNMPVGMQLIGNYFSEAKLFQIAQHYQLNTNWHTLAPKINLA